MRCSVSDRAVPGKLRLWSWNGEALAKVTATPARLLGLEAGRMAKGAPAHMVVIDVDQPWKIKEDLLVSKSKNTLFDGRPVQGRCLMTVYAGETVFSAVQ